MFTWLKRYAEFNGRSSRKEYWLTVLCMVLLGIAACVIDMIAFGGFLDWSDTGPTQLSVGLGTIVPSIAVTVRRLHDTDRSGWWALIALIPLAGAIVLFVFSVLPGEPRDNRFGPPPPETPGLTGEPPAPQPTVSPA
jgi:uncharacterized membrane protein YhaH (DUF805 family)